MLFAQSLEFPPQRVASTVGGVRVDAVICGGRSFPFLFLFCPNFPRWAIDSSSSFPSFLALVCCCCYYSYFSFGGRPVGGWVSVVPCSDTTTWAQLSRWLAKF